MKKNRVYDSKNNEILPALYTNNLKCFAVLHNYKKWRRW